MSVVVERGQPSAAAGQMGGTVVGCFLVPRLFHGEQMEGAIDERRVEKLKVVADGFAGKLAANGFSTCQGIDALKPFLRVEAPAQFEAFLPFGGRPRRGRSQLGFCAHEGDSGRPEASAGARIASGLDQRC